MSVILTVCDTCKRADWAQKGVEQTDGDALADAVEKICADHEDITLRRHSCLMGCDYGCNVSLQESDKLTYVIGEFEPSTDAAQAIVDFAQLYSESETGQVPYRTWPQGIKGHFRARIPPAPKA